MVNIIISCCLIFFVTWFFVTNIRRRRKNVDQMPESKLDSLLGNNIAFYNQLKPNDKERFRSLVKFFLNTINIEGVGIEVTEDDRIMIAASAIIPIFGFPEWEYKNLTNVILYPDTFNNDFEFEGKNNRNVLGMVGSGYMNGQMILSKAALLRGFSKNSGKENAAIHEFVHLIDSADGATDGTPEIIDNFYAKPWLQMMYKEINEIKKGHSDINPYAATNDAEFLAVASEYFFEKPDKFKSEHPDLYRQLSLAFNQNPAKIE